MSDAEIVKMHTAVSWVHKHGFAHARIVRPRKNRNNPIDPIDATHRACWCLGVV
jgi:hypothetical protein